MAAAFYNKFTDSHDAASAGTGVDVPGETSGETLGERQARRGGTVVIQAMRDEEDIDISGSMRTQLTQDMLDAYDYIISMAQKEHTPEWLSSHPKYIYWDVADPGGKDYAHTQIAKEAVKRRVRDFIASVD